MGPEEDDEEKTQADRGKGKKLQLQGTRQSIYDHTHIKKKQAEKNRDTEQPVVPPAKVHDICETQSATLSLFSLSVFPVTLILLKKKKVGKITKDKCEENLKTKN